MTPKTIIKQWAADARERRIAQRLTQAELASHAGVSLGLIKRFEKGGGINLHTFARIGSALGRLDALRDLLRPEPTIQGFDVKQADLATLSIADLETAQPRRVKAPVRVRHSKRAAGGVA